MLFQREAKVIKNTKVKQGHYSCILSSSRIARGAQPGQFVNLRLTSEATPLLRRPFSIHSLANSKITLLYQVLGEGTKLLSQKKAGEYLDIIGPLGTGFNCERLAARNAPCILVAGGMGVAPLVFLAEKLKETQKSSLPASLPIGREPKHKIQNAVLIGAKTANQILCEKEFRKLGFDVKIATDDGSRGFEGRVTELLKEVLASGCKYAALYSCGPHPMLKEAALIAKSYNIPTEVSLEEHMACGIGACLGCVVATRSGLKRVCKEGPVFKAQDVIW